MDLISEFPEATPLEKTCLMLMSRMNELEDEVIRLNKEITCQKQSFDQLSDEWYSTLKGVTFGLKGKQCRTLHSILQLGQKLYKKLNETIKTTVDISFNIIVNINNLQDGVYEDTVMAVVFWNKSKDPRLCLQIQDFLKKSTPIEDDTIIENISTCSNSKAQRRLHKGISCRRMHVYRMKEDAEVLYINNHIMV